MNLKLKFFKMLQKQENEKLILRWFLDSMAKKKQNKILEVPRQLKIIRIRGETMFKKEKL
ncbi:hypothetical protein HMSSN036_66770 [Paenibacillus macerans]|nr:hypothetical protein HMSSN036_66770 [Paenibacillus macerans]